MVYFDAGTVVSHLSHPVPGFDVIFISVMIFASCTSLAVARVERASVTTFAC